jgi:hypothetical protein
MSNQGGDFIWCALCLGRLMLSHYAVSYDIGDVIYFRAHEEMK